MKYIIKCSIALTAIILQSLTLMGQDTLYMKSGIKIPSQIIEISPLEVKYKKLDNIDGPTFVTHNADINLIKYKNGAVDTIRVQSSSNPVVKSTPVVPKVIDPHPPIYAQGMFYKYDGRRIKAKEMHSILGKMNDPELNLHIKKAKTAKGLEYIGYLAIPTFVFGLGYTGFALINNELDGATGVYYMSYGPGAASLAVAAASLATSITFKVVGKKHNQKAIDLYNEKY